MNLEYKNGVRITKFAHEKDAYEAELDKHELRAREFYAKDSQSSVEVDRKKALAESLAFLAKERAKLSTISSIQVQLREYRAQGMLANKDNSDMWSRADALDLLTTEDYHPTDMLEQNMRAEGVPKPSSQHTAHHICPGKGNLPDTTRLARDHLHIHGIRINDPANGVYLIHKDKDTPHWDIPESRGHRKYHTHGYEELLWKRLAPRHTMDQIKTELQVIGRIIQHNEPRTAFAKMAKKGQVT
jgi:hypothetical protein